MSRLSRTFARLTERNEGALVAYVTAGDPDLSSTPGIVGALVEGGADVIELGIPFSDPIADGPVIQAASTRALKTGTTPRKVLKTIDKMKDSNRIPIVAMTYYNPIFRMSLKNFFESARACGVDGVIVPDLSIEEADEYKKLAEACDIDTIFLAAPSTSIDRLGKILKYSSGFLYLVSVFGVTGIRETMEHQTVKLIRKTLRSTRGKIPLSVGFGISKPEHVQTVISNGADAAIVGSGFVRIIERNKNNEGKMLRELEDCARQLKKATMNEQNAN